MAFWMHNGKTGGKILGVVTYTFPFSYRVCTRNSRWRITMVMKLLLLLGGGARFETTDVPETIGPDLTVSVLSQSFTKARGR